MFYLRLISFLFIVGSFNVLALVLAHSLPAVQDFHRQVLALTAGFLIMADAILLYIMAFKLPLLKKSDRYRKFEEILEETSSGDEPSKKEFERAFKRWEDNRR